MYYIRECQKFAQSYLDDIVVYSHSWSEHLQHLQEAFERLQQAGLTVKLKKCCFGQDHTHYLGHVIGGGEVRPDSVQAVRNYPEPRTKKDVRSFLGSAGYYQRFIPEFSTVATPLTQLTKKGRPDNISFDQSCRGAFSQLK